MKNRIHYLPLVFVMLSLVCTGLQGCKKSSKTQSSKVKPDSSNKAQRMQWWSDATFGMFIHWGIYAVPAQGEWYMTTGHVPQKEYEKYATQFNPHHFNAEYWVRLAKMAGMKYIVITSKHHDGFAMFNTSTTQYDVVDASPWHTDPMKALSKAAKKYDIKLGFYYSIMDWHSKYQLPADNSDPQHPTYNPTKIKPGKKDEYIKYMKTQLRELIKQYDPAILWFDGEWPDWWTYEDGEQLYHWLRDIDPDLIINNRIGKRPGSMEKIGMGERAVGDFGTPEQSVPPNGIPGTYWEVCMTINNNWGYAENDHDFKSDTTLIRKLIDIASKGGNYLLNVGPTAQGTIPLPEVKRLAAMGHWLNIYGEAIYATKASPFKKKFDWGRVTQKEDKLYLMIYHWPEDGKITLPAYKGKVMSSHLMSDPDRQGVTVQQNGEHLVVNLPGKMPNEIASVVEVSFEL